MASPSHHPSPAGLGLILLTCVVASPAAGDHLLVTTSDFAAGNLASVALSPPWASSTDLEAIGTDAVARHWDGLHWIVNRSPVDAVQVIDPATWTTVRTLAFEPGSNPHDIVVTGGKAYVSLHARPFVLVVDPVSGAPLDSIDVSSLADADGIPDLSRMEVHAGRLFVQVQRLENFTPVAPSYLAVIDMAQATLVGSIPLTGLHPVNDMQVEGDRLYVMEHGDMEIIDPYGGIDVIDLNSLTATGFLTDEGRLGADTDCFVLVSPTKGYAV
ncbi:MAG: YncE family protein, partial [Candidatus Eiseniibacteriota bacterium]